MRAGAPSPDEPCRNEPPVSAFVLGFADEAAQIAGLAWSLAGRDGALLALGGELSDPAASASIDGESIRVESTVADREITVEASAGAGFDLVAEPAPPASPGGALVRAEVRIAGPGGDETVSCASNLTRWDGDPADGAELVRHVSVPVAGDGAILMIATRPAGADDHATESVAAWRLDPGEDPSPFVESLLSTQYDDDGKPTRAGLELWPADPDAPATRAAGSRALSATADGVTATLMHTSAEGTAGVGGYLIARP